MPRKLLITLLTGCLLLAGCATALHPSKWTLPWRHAPVAEPAPVQELGVEGEAAASVRQTWQRNTLRIDLTGVAPAGSLKLLPNAADGWPLRMEFAVRPGRFATLEVRGEQRVVFAVVGASGAEPVQILALAPAAYSPATAAITVSWH
jgi:hypothetical protein